MKTIGVLRRLHCLETMAVEIYRAQVAHLADPGERERMAAAAENETVHRTALMRLLEGRGASPSPLRVFWRLAGLALGLGPALLGRNRLLASDLAFEEKAVREYGEILDGGLFTGDEACLLARFREDETRHASTWRELLGKGGGKDKRD